MGRILGGVTDRLKSREE